MIRSSILSSLILSLVLVAGCKKDPPGITPPDDGNGQTAGTDGGKTDTGGDTGAGGEEGGDGDSGGEAVDPNDPTKKVCPGETAEFPEVYFEDTVMIRLPKNVTLDNFVEMAPGFARISGEVESVSCIEGVPGAVISYMALGSFPEDKAKPMTAWRDETLEAFGYKGSAMSEETIDEGKRILSVVLDVPAGEKPEPAKALFYMVAANGFMYALVMETHPDAWNALKSTFADTAAKMKFLKPK